jgi:hypothetical protein
LCSPALPHPRAVTTRHSSLVVLVYCCLVQCQEIACFHSLSKMKIPLKSPSQFRSPAFSRQFVPRPRDARVTDIKDVMYFQSRFFTSSSSSLDQSSPTSGSKISNTKGPTVNSHPMPERMPPLQNDFFLLRHGQSTANLQGIISSARSLANSPKHGLTELGWEQGRQSASQLLDLIEKEQQENGKPTTVRRKVYFYSSPFARYVIYATRHETEICASFQQYIIHVTVAHVSAILRKSLIYFPRRLERKRQQWRVWRVLPRKKIVKEFSN